MNVLVRGKNCGVPNGVRELAMEKVARAGRLARDAQRAEVEFTETGHHHSPPTTTCEVTVHLRRTIVRAHAAGADAANALDRTIDKVEQQLARIKDKRVTRRHGRHRSDGAGSAVGLAEMVEAPLPDELDEPSDDQALHIVREKSFDSKPMPPEEAALQMDLLDHDFFLFRNAENGKAAVIYRRRDGNLGLIETTG